MINIMDTIDSATHSTNSGRGVLKDVRHIHEAITLMILDISEGADSQTLNIRLQQIQEMTGHLATGLREMDRSQPQYFRILDPSLRKTACEKCLLQVGEDRNQG
jgi:hypothetical protein